MKKEHFIRLFLMLVVFLVSVQIQAQLKISGVVTDENKKPLSGVSVLLKGTTSGTTSDSNGVYAITIQARSKTLVFSSVGYTEKEVEIGSQTVLNVTLSSSNKELEDVVVVGYGTMRKSDLTGAISSVKIDEKVAARVNSLDQLLKGRAAGVQITNSSSAPGASVDIKIRGISSFSGSEPLYVVDGNVLTPPSLDNGNIITHGITNNDASQETNGLMGISPQDIASIEILKDASATAIYGSLGANGVVLITTKAGSNAKTSIDFTTTTSFSNIIRNPKTRVLNSDEFVEYAITQKMIRDGGNGNAPNFNGFFTNTFKDTAQLELGYKDGIVGVDWLDYVTRVALSQNYNLRISGGSEKGNFLVSGAYKKNIGIVKNSEASMFTLYTKFNKNLGNRFKLGASINYANISLDLTQSTDNTRMNSSTALFKSVANSKPFINNQTVDKFLNNDYEEGDDTNDDDELFISAPVSWLKDFSDHTADMRFTPNFYLEARLNNWLTFRTTLGADIRNKERSKWKGPLIFTSAETSVAGVSNLSFKQYNMQNMLMFNKRLGKHRVSGTVGMTLSDSRNRVQTVEGWNITQYEPQYLGINEAPFSRIAYTESRYSLLSYLARGIYNYDNRYVLTATYRIDGSSKFSEKNRYSDFPSFAFAWRVNNEKWLQMPNSVSNMKLRLGWGRVGSQTVAPYQTMPTFSFVNYANHTVDENGQIIDKVIGLRPSNLANSDLVWETTEQLNLGMDLGFIKDRFNFSIDLYDKRTKDLLQQVNIPVETGFSSMWANLGEIQNRGIELSADAGILKNRNILWNLNGNISFNKNKILSIGIPASEGSRWPPYFFGNIIGTSNYLRTPINIFMEGSPMGLFYGYQTNGLVQEGKEGPGLTEASGKMQPGGVNYVLQPGNTVGYLTENDKVIIGNPNPDFTYGFGTDFSFNSFNLSLIFNGVKGNDIVNLADLTETDISRVKNIRASAFYDAWTPTNTAAKYPALGSMTESEGQYFSDRIVMDGSFLRLANITFSYDLELRKNKILKRCVFNFSIGNVYTWTHYNGWDPEVSSFGSNIMRMGIDNGSYPMARTFSLGIITKF